MCVYLYAWPTLADCENELAENQPKRFRVSPASVQFGDKRAKILSASFA